MRGLLIVVLAFTGCVSTVVSHSAMASLPVLPLAQVAPESWVTAWAGSQLSPLHEIRRDSNSGVFVPAAQPELGGVVLAAERHFMMGGSVHFAPTEWRRSSSANQLALRDTAMIGARMRLGLRFDFGRFGVMGSFDPGFDLIPWASTGVLSGSPFTLQPAFGGTLTPFVMLGGVRLFVGASANTMTKMAAVDTLPGSCLSCDGPGVGLSGRVFAVAGVRYELENTVSVGASVTVPLNQEDPHLLPMLAMSLTYQWDRAPQVEEGEQHDLPAP